MLHLVRDVLDGQLVDRRGRPMGRVDGVVITLSPGNQAPEVIAIEMGAAVNARRLHRRLGYAVAALLRRLGGSDVPYRLSWSKVKIAEDNIQADVSAEDTPVLAWERWLRDKVIGRIPGA